MALPVFIPAIIGGLVSAVGTLVGKVLVGLGIGYVTYTGITPLVDLVVASVISNVQALPAQTLGIVKRLGLGIVISMFASAFVVRMTLAGLQSGSIKKMVQK